jgi:hypothetical protein
MRHIEIAKKFIGQKEGANNDFDESTPLGKILKEAGHKDGEAWCCYFTEAVFVETLRSLFSASTIQTFQNFKDAGYEITDTPKVGALVIWQRYKDGKATWQGHAGIVSKVNTDGSFSSIEGNTNSAGSREGDSVQEKVRQNIRTENGLNVLGFVNIL